MIESDAEEADLFGIWVDICGNYVFVGAGDDELHGNERNDALYEDLVLAAAPATRRSVCRFW